jgi:hypothetical protein
VVTEKDIFFGRVFMLNPVCLKPDEEDVTIFASGLNSLGGNSPHYFVCLDVIGDYSFWCPVSSSQKKLGIGSDKQVKLPQGKKSGKPHFIFNDTWMDPKQVWRIHKDILVKCARQDVCNDPAAWVNVVDADYLETFIEQLTGEKPACRGGQSM